MGRHRDWGTASLGGIRVRLLIKICIIDEIDALLTGIEESEVYSNTIEKDIKVLEILKLVEDSAGVLTGIND